MSNLDEELKSAGWERRSVTEEKRIVELVELYESLGFEVHLESLSQELITTIGEDCKECFNQNWDNFKVIYTRKLKED